MNYETDLEGRLTEVRDLPPWKDGGVGAVLADGSAVDQPRGDGLAGELGLPEPEAPEGVGRNGFAGFDLHSMKRRRAGLNKSVNLVAFLVAQKMEEGSETGVGLGFEEFRDDPIFKKSPAQGV